MVKAENNQNPELKKFKACLQFNDKILSFYNTFVKLHGKKIGNRVSVLYPNPCYTNVCYKGTALRWY